MARLDALFFRRSGPEFVAQCVNVTRLLARALQSQGGSISAKHGIGW